MALERSHKQILWREKKNPERKIANHAWENTKDLCGSVFGLHPRQRQGKSFAKKYEEYKGGVEPLSQTQNPIHPNNSISKSSLSTLNIIQG